MLRALAVALTCVSFCAAPALAEGLSANQIVEVATTSVEADGTESVTFAAATDVEPGELIRYRLDYSNDGADAAENVALVMPVPAEVTFIEASVEGAPSAVSYSADDGATFATRDAVMVADGDQARLASAAEITHIKWEFAEPIAPAATGTVSFRATLN